MKLEDLLSELRENVLRDDAELAAGPDDQLWSDATLVRYLEEAQQRYARLTLCIRDDSTPGVVQVALRDGIDQYTLHPAVLSVASVRYNTDQTDLSRTSHTLARAVFGDDPPYWCAYPATYPPGRPFSYATDETVVGRAGAVTLKLSRVPSADEDGKLLYLRVARRPLCSFTLDKPGAVCEIPDDYQLDMIEWAAYRALRTSDIDGHSALGDAAKARFDNSVMEVLKDVRRKTFAPITWGFGFGGFTWSP